MFHLLFAASHLSHSTFFSTSNSLCLYLQLLLPERTTTPSSVDFPYVNLQVSIPMAAFASPPQSSPYIWLLVSWYAGPRPPLCVLACQHSLFPSPSPPPSLSQSFFSPSSLSSSCRPSTLFYQNTAQSKKGEQRGTGPVGGRRNGWEKKTIERGYGLVDRGMFHLKEELKEKNMTPRGDKG